ncbi:MAG: hypothetical protein K2Q03_10025 [Sphingobacteriaceae bacterium]|nr:hypothetical protein [Sphingobacteriaceae bacterium]
MIILAHRGFWNKIEDKNTLQAFIKAWQNGYGIETDLRDLNGKIVISHDIPTLENELLDIDDFFTAYKKQGQDTVLALNIKSDGLQLILKQKIIDYQIENYFVFDMSVPDAIQYHKHDFKMFTRKSEYEIHPSLYDFSKGLWLDEFEKHWIENSFVEDLIAQNKAVCIVSPELHKRDFEIEWQDYKKVCLLKNIMICTDFPDKANKYFNED